MSSTSVMKCARARALSKGIALIATLLLLGGCKTLNLDPYLKVGSEAPRMPAITSAELGLRELPAPLRQIDVGVYGYPDLTGQNKPNTNFAEFSRAVTQGGVHFLIDALMAAGDGNWFNVVERTGLNNLLQERRIIRGTREEFSDGNQPAMPPLRFAGLMLEGGIVAYDTNLTTGGAGAAWLGVGADWQYQRDMVTVSLRAVSVQSGEVLASVSATKTVYSVATQGMVFRYIAVDELLQAEAGVTYNEPPQLAVRQAIELAVYNLILEGHAKNLWDFSDAAKAAPVVERYRQLRNGGISEDWSGGTLFEEIVNAEG